MAATTTTTPPPLGSPTNLKRMERRDGRGPAHSSLESIPSSALPPTVPSGGSAPPLARVAAPLARRFQQVCAAMIADALSGEEVVQLEYGSLVCLEIEPGIDQRRLAEAMGIDPSNTSLIVDRLHSKGLIERRIKGADRRARELYLTPKGKKRWRRLRPLTASFCSICSSVSSKKTEPTPALAPAAANGALCNRLPASSEGTMCTTQRFARALAVIILGALALSAAPSSAE